MLPGKIPVSLSICRAAAHLGVHHSKFRSSVLNGWGPVCGEDGQYSDADLEEWISRPQPLIDLAFAQRLARGYVYFIHPVGGGNIKVGFTVDFGSRFEAIQACSPVKLELLLATHGSKRLEHAIHKYFRKYRLHGEWFIAVPALLELIAGIQERRESEIRIADERPACLAQNLLGGGL